MPLIEKDNNSVTLNLTWPFIIWTVFFGLLAWAFDSTMLLFVALLPWLLMIAFVMFVFGVMCAAVTAAYIKGVPVTWTNKLTGKTKTFKRKHKD